MKNRGATIALFIIACIVWILVVHKAFKRGANKSENQPAKLNIHTYSREPKTSPYKLIESGYPDPFISNDKIEKIINPEHINIESRSPEEIGLAFLGIITKDNRTSILLILKDSIITTYVNEEIIKRLRVVLFSKDSIKIELDGKYFIIKKHE